MGTMVFRNTSPVKSDGAAEQPSAGNRFGQIVMFFTAVHT